MMLKSLRGWGWVRVAQSDELGRRVLTGWREGLLLHLHWGLVEVIGRNRSVLLLLLLLYRDVLGHSR
jgi:hypothetical protein